MSTLLRQQWDNFYGWINRHGGFTKVVAAVIVILGLAYGAVPEFHNFCVSIWSQFPTKIKTVLVAVFALYSWLHNPATKRIVEGIVGPGDTATAINPTVTSDGTLTASSITVQKSPESVPIVPPADLTSPLIISKSPRPGLKIS